MNEEVILWSILGVFIAMLVISVLTIVIQKNFKKKHKEFSLQRNSVNKTGAQIAREILDKHEIKNIKIFEGKEGRDNFNPMNNSISLSPSVYNSSSVAAAAIAAHEVGHAIQWEKKEIKIKIRTALAKPLGLISQLGMLLFNLSFMLIMFSLFTFSGSEEAFFWMAIAGLIAYGANGIFQLITLPVEFNASHKAMTELKEGGYIKDEEVDSAKSLLTSAALTYVFAFLSTLAMFAIFLLQIFLRSSR